MSVAAPPAPLALQSPYKGLAPFEDSEQDALLFFGRERECEVVVANLLASKLTVLYGPSGVGKSSMLKAAVVRRLRELEPDAEVVVLDEWAGTPTLPRLEGEAYLILDQFEEYFLYHGEGLLLEELPELLAQPRLHMLISLRDDSLARLDALQAAIPNVLGNRLRVDHLDRAAARAAIVGPLDRWNEIVPPEERVGIEAGLITAVLDEVAAAPAGNGSSAAGLIEAPYLQLVMERVWEEEHAAGSRLLRLDTLERLGGARAIVSAHLQRTLGALSPHDAAIAASALTYLVTPSRTKIAQSFDDLVGYTDEPPAELRSVLDLLAAQRILRAASTDGGAEGRRYEIFHDVLAEPVLTWRRAFVASAALEREREAADRRHRRLLVITGGAALLAAAMVALAVYAFSQQNEASKQQKAAEAAKAVAIQRAVRLKHETKKAQKAERAAKASAAQSQQDQQAADQSAKNATAATASANSANAAAQQSAQDANAARIRAVRNGKLAQHQAALARAATQREHKTALQYKVGELVATAAAKLGVDPVQSVQAALQASTLDPSSTQVEDALRSSLGELQVRAILDAGGGAVNAASFSPDGDLVATGSANGTLRLFRSGTHARLQSHALKSPVTTLAFGPETTTFAAGASGGLLAAGTQDGRTVIYDIATGRLQETLHDSAGVLDVVFAAGGRVVLTGSADSSLRIWDSATGQLLRAITETRAVQTIAVSSDGSLAATMQPGDPVVRVYAIPSGDPVKSVQQPGEITDIAFSPDGKYLVSTGRRNAYVWDTKTWTALQILAGHTAAIDDVVFAPDDRVVTVSVDSSARVWDPATGATLATLLGVSQQKALAAAVSPDGTQITTVGNDGVARVWNAPLGAIPRSLGGHTDSITSVSYSRDGSLLLTASADGTARLWATTVPTLATLGSHAGPVSAVAYSADGKSILSAATDGARIWNAAGAVGLTLPQGAAVTDASFTPDGSSVLTAGQDGTAKLWNTSTGVLRTTFPHGAPVRAALPEPDGGVVTAGDDGVVRAWTATGRLLWAKTHGSPIAALAVASDGTVATGAADGSVRLWRGRDGAALRTLLGHKLAISSLAFDPGGDLLVSGSADDTARVWNVKTGAFHVLAGHKFGVTSVQFSPNGKLVLTASVDGDAWLWDARTGKTVHRLKFHVATVSQAVFSPDGKWVLTAGPTTAGIWQVRTGKLFFYVGGAHGNLTSAAWAPDSQRIVVGDTGGGVETYRCTLCTGVSGLRVQAEQRLHEIFG